jgi:2-polyprenyl-6-methoxyphenol hydroxylase-like FAD-dependent oxidoreductase
MPRTDVLIVGAGPSGLVLALWLIKQGVRVRIVDKGERAVENSRALAVHARTLELYRQLDLADDVVADGHQTEAWNLWSEGTHKTRVSVGEMGKGLTPYPFILVYPQDRHEKVLEERLNSLGVQVERHHELVDFTEHDSHITARFRDPRKQTDPDPSKNDSDIETCEATFIIGCDGAHSAVRRTCEMEFEGGTYSHLFFVADVEGGGRPMNGEMHLGLGRSEVTLLFAYDRGRNARLAGVVDEKSLTKDISEATFEDVAPHITKAMGLKIDEVNWFSTYRVHHRMAGAFRKGRAFLVGDAAHIHSPVGGQGMNTGIGDAINLAWKLAAVLQQRADISLLDSYEVERAAFAKSLLQTTDRAFNTIVSQGYIARFVRSILVPSLAGVILGFDLSRKGIFRRVSQIGINYRHSALSAGSAGYVQGGDRLPWAPVGDADNFDSLKAITWQVHVYGAVKNEMTEWCQSMGIPLHVFPWNQKYQEAGLAQDTAYLVRPDTCIAVAEPTGLPESFSKMLQDNHLRLS